MSGTKLLISGDSSSRLIQCPLFQTRRYEVWIGTTKTAQQRATCWLALTRECFDSISTWGFRFESSLILVFKHSVHHVTDIYSVSIGVVLHLRRRWSVSNNAVTQSPPSPKCLVIVTRAPRGCVFFERWRPDRKVTMGAGDCGEIASAGKVNQRFYRPFRCQIALLL